MPNYGNWASAAGAPDDAYYNDTPPKPLKPRARASINATLNQPTNPASAYGQPDDAYIPGYARGGPVYKNSDPTHQQFNRTGDNKLLMKRAR